MEAEINTLTSTRVPRGPTIPTQQPPRPTDLHARTEGTDQLITLGRTLKRRAGDILAYFDHPTPPMAPPKPSTDASNTYAAPPQDFRNLTHYITRALLETGGFKPQLHPQL